MSELLFKNTKLGFTEVLSFSAWACWSIPLLVTEIVLQAGKLKLAAKKNLPSKGGITNVLVVDSKQNTEQ